MTNDELQMTKEIRSSKVERRAGVRSAVSSFGFRCSFGFRESSFGFGDCGSWGALFRFFTCIGAKNPPLTPPRRGTFAAESMDHAVAFGVRASSAPLSQGRLQFDRRAGSWKAPTTLMPCIGTMNRGTSHSGRKAPINRTHSKRFARFGDARQSRSVWSACGFSAAFPCQAQIR